jgi:hypothetical protein
MSSQRDSVSPASGCLNGPKEIHDKHDSSIAAQVAESIRVGENGVSMQNSTLTAQERHRLLSVLRELDQQAPNEKRRDLRRRVHGKMTIRILGSNSSLRISSVVNVSSHGVALLLREPLTPKAKFLLPLRFCEGGGWLVLCEVRNCVPQPRHQWRIGARFLDHIEDPRGNAKPPLDWLM